MNPSRTVLEALGALITYAWDNFHNVIVDVPQDWDMMAGLAQQRVTEPDYGDMYQWDVLGFGTGTSSVSLDRLPLDERDESKITCGATTDGLGVIIFQEFGVALQFKPTEGSQARM